MAVQVNWETCFTSLIVGCIRRKALLSICIVVVVVTGSQNQKRKHQRSHLAEHHTGNNQGSGKSQVRRHEARRQERANRAKVQEVRDEESQSALGQPIWHRTPMSPKMHNNLTVTPQAIQCSRHVTKPGTELEGARSVHKADPCNPGRAQFLPPSLDSAKPSSEISIKTNWQERAGAGCGSTPCFSLSRSCLEHISTTREITSYIVYCIRSAVVVSKEKS